MAKNQELELSILIGGHVDNSLAQAVKLANTQIGSIANGASKFAENIAKGAVAAAGGIAAAVVDTTKESVSFESEMLDVTKYVSGLTDDSGKVIRSNYEEMSKDILDLSTDIPYTAEELTRLAAAAGQSGKSMDDLISDGFLRDVAEMGTAMDISADQAGDWAAKWEVAFDINHDQVMELADQINYLGAHYATTAAEIAQTVNDTGSLGQIAGMDVASTAALSTALLAMGVDSGKVATSIRRMYTNLSMGSKATDAQAAAFEQLGFTAEQFAKDMQTDAPAAIKSLFTAIGSQPKDKQVGYLKTLLGQWAIESGAKLTGNLDLFIKTLDDVGDASKYNGSMYKEFLLKCETSESVLTMLSNAWRAVRIEVGNNFLPILKDVAGFGIEKINDFRAALPDITARVKEVIEYLLNNGDKVAATLGGIGAAWAGMRFAPQILQLFYTTQIPVSLWFISKRKKQPGKTLFIDARKMGVMVSRKLRELTDGTKEEYKNEDGTLKNDIKKIADTYNAYVAGTLGDVKGFCAVATTEEIAKQDYILTPGRYVGVEEQEDDGEPFEEKMARLTSELSDLFKQSHKLEAEIKEKLGAIGYEI